MMRSSRETTVVFLVNSQTLSVFFSVQHLEVSDDSRTRGMYMWFGRGAVVLWVLRVLSSRLY